MSEALLAAPIDPEADALFALAARGDLEAQRKLLAVAVDAAHNGQITYTHAIWGSQILARMAAAHGHAEDRLYLASILFHLAAIDRETGGSCVSGYQAEGLAILNTLADEGDEKAAEWLNHAVAALPTETVAAAEEIGRHVAASGVTVH